MNRDPDHVDVSMAAGVTGGNGTENSPYDVTMTGDGTVLSPFDIGDDDDDLGTGLIDIGDDDNDDDDDLGTGLNDIGDDDNDDDDDDGTEQPPSDNTCPICWNDLSSCQNPHQLTTCGHVFCRSCIVTWRKSCPLCRTPIPHNEFGSCGCTERDRYWRAVRDL
jgi:hypothetical protein